MYVMDNKDKKTWEKPIVTDYDIKTVLKTTSTTNNKS